VFRFVLFIIICLLTEDCFANICNQLLNLKTKSIQSQLFISGMLEEHGNILPDIARLETHLADLGSNISADTLPKLLLKKVPTRDINELSKLKFDGEDFFYFQLFTFKEFKELNPNISREQFDKLWEKAVELYRGVSPTNQDYLKSYQVLINKSEFLSLVANSLVKRVWLSRKSDKVANDKKIPVSFAGLVNVVINSIKSGVKPYVVQVGDVSSRFTKEDSALLIFDRKDMPAKELAVFIENIVVKDIKDLTEDDALKSPHFNLVSWLEHLNSTDAEQVSIIEVRLR